MSYIFNSTLQRQADNRLKSENSFLYENYRNIFINHFFNFKNWYYVLVSTLILFFFLEKIDIDLFNIIDVDSNEVKQLIENRTTNIVTLISVTFAVIGFLIANLAIKDSYIYNLIFRESRFFSITYFVLTLIASFIILSTLKTHLELEYVKRVYITGTYLILIAVIFIAYLFTRLIQYTNDKYLCKIIKDDFCLESKKYLAGVMIESYMHGILFNEVGFNKYHMFFQNRLFGFPDANLPSNSIVKDLKIEKIKKILRKNQISHESIYVNLNSNGNFSINQNGFFFISNNLPNVNLQDVIRELNKCIVLQKAEVEQLPIETILDYINQKIVEHTSKNNHKQVSEFTNMLSEYYELQLKIKTYV